MQSCRSAALLLVILLLTTLTGCAGVFQHDRPDQPASYRVTVPIDGPLWVGSAERPEFLRQNDLLANIWTGLGAEIRCVHAEGRHHFDVIEDLIDPASKLSETLVWESESVACS